MTASYHRSRERSAKAPDARATLDTAARSAHDADVPPRAYHSPLTGDVWPDPRPAIGTIAGLANYLNERRPRRKPPDGHDAAIALATEAAGAIAGIPKITRTGEVAGRAISDAYWQAKDAKAKLSAFVDDGQFIQGQQWRGSDWARTRDSRRAGLIDIRPKDQGLTLSTRAARLAWYAANLTEKVAANSDGDMDDRSYAHDAVLGSLMELEIAGIPRETSAGIERVWRFVVAAGRLPQSPADDDLLAAFEAALMAGESDFAAHLAKHGWGVTGSDPA